MPCTTILVGKHASHDGSTIVARNEDSCNGEFTPKRFDVVRADEQPRHYVSVLSHFELDLPDDPLRYTSLPNALPDEGLWAAAGINAANVGMSATETITTNERVLAADPLVASVPATGNEDEDAYQPAVAGGIGEEDMVTLVLPYIRSAREGVLRLGALLERLGTYESNGIAFHDADEIWWLETIGGHHWIARRVPDYCYVTMPNQLGIDRFDLADAEGVGREYLCSPDLRAFVEENHLALELRGARGSAYTGADADKTLDVFNPRLAFGSSSDADRVYNTPRAWNIQRFLNPLTCTWDGPNADYDPESANIPWCRVPEHLLTVEDVKAALSLHFQGTPYDPYGRPGSPDVRGIYRTIGINRTSQLSATQIRGNADGGSDGSAPSAIQWIAFGSNPFNAFVPLFADVDEAPAYFSTTPANVSTESFYWANRLIGALADAHYAAALPHVERYAQRLVSAARRIILLSEHNGTSHEDANAEIASLARTMTDELLSRVLFEASMGMTNAFLRNDT